MIFDFMSFPRFIFAEIFFQKVEMDSLQMC